MNVLTFFDSSFLTMSSLPYRSQFRAKMVADTKKIASLLFPYWCIAIIGHLNPT
jgi:hypothetical protein